MAIVEVRHVDGHLLASVEAESLAHCDFRNMRLDGADFRGQKLCIRPPVGGSGTHHTALFDNADLTEADFRGADISENYFRGCTLTNARFDGARINFCSHTVLAEIVRQRANCDPAKLGGAQFILDHPRWTWRDFLYNETPESPWVHQILKTFMLPDDHHLEYRQIPSELLDRWSRV
jgi:hypothetical protein